MSNDEFKNLFPEISNPAFIIISVRLSWLFHDIGHGPFSHSAEDLMLKVTKDKHAEEIKKQKNYLMKILKKNFLSTNTYKCVSNLAGL